jgi:hypothetical protein
MESMPESLRDRLLALAQRWGETELFGANIRAITDSLKGQIVDSSLPDDQRAGAAKRLIGLTDKTEIVEAVLMQVTLLSPPALATGLINALTEGRNPQTGRALVEHWTQFRRSLVGPIAGSRVSPAGTADAELRQADNMGTPNPAHGRKRRIST